MARETAASDTQPARRAPDWDVTAMRGHAPDLATATPSGERIALTFGARTVTAGVHAARPLACVSVSPLTARHLADMLRDLLARHDAAS